MDKVTNYVVLSPVNFIQIGEEIELTEKQAERAIARGDLCTHGDARAMAAVQQLDARRAAAKAAAAKELQAAQEETKSELSGIDKASRASDLHRGKGLRVDLSGS